MNTSLVKADNYSLFTFGSTSHALKAETVLKELGAEFLIMPTLREISASCGLSVKIFPENAEPYYDMLTNHNVAVQSVYHVQKINRKNNVEKVM
ncbi:MAG: DUF3343 domain-containing protein [Syntrophomonas sp.]